MISTDYHTDDFDLGAKAMNWNRNYGRCEGGPWNNKHLSDHREVFPVAIDQFTKKAIPAVVVSTDPDVKFGAYHFADGAWTWRRPDSE